MKRAMYEKMALKPFLYAMLGFKILRVEPEEEVREIPEEADFRGVGGLRVGPSEPEVAVRESS